MKHSSHHIVFLSITDFIGISPGAEHYYGSLQYDGGFDNEYKDRQKVRLEHKLSREEIRTLNRKNEMRMPGLGNAYEVGDESENFSSEQQLIDLAIEKYKEVHPGAGYLVVGRPGILDPFMVVAGNDEAVMGEANRLFEEFEGLERDNRGALPKDLGATADAIELNWHQLLQTWWADILREKMEAK